MVGRINSLYAYAVIRPIKYLLNQKGLGSNILTFFYVFLTKPIKPSSIFYVNLGYMRDMC